MKKVRCVLLTRNMLDDQGMRKTLESIFCVDKEKIEIIIDRDNPEYIVSDTGIYEREYNYQIFKKLYSKERIKVLVVDEAEYPDLNLFDYVLMYMDSHLKCDDRIYAMPHSFLYGINENELCGAGQELLKQELQKKTSFCNFLYSNPNAHFMRDQLFYVLNDYKKVDAIGRHLNNVDGCMNDRSSADWFLSSVEKKSKYKFTIAAENADFPGYTSEKIVSSFRAHSIPIYWGDQNIAERFNEEAFINANKYENLTSLAEEVRRIDESDDLWMEMVSKPWRTPQQLKSEQLKMEAYRMGVRKILQQDMEKAHRIPDGTHMTVYTNHWMEPAKWGSCLFIENKKGCAIFGSGHDGQDCLNSLRKLGIEAECFYDNNVDKWGTTCQGIPIISFDEWKTNKKIIIVASAAYEKDIFFQLEAAGAQAGIDYVSYSCICELLAVRKG